MYTIGEIKSVHVAVPLPTLLIISCVIIMYHKACPLETGIEQ